MFASHLSATWHLADPLKVDSCDLEQSTKRAAFSLINAAARGLLRQVQALLAMGVSPDSYCSGTTALGEAATNGHLNCLKALLSAGADPNFTVSGISPLMKAILANQQGCYSVLLTRDDVNLGAMDNANTSTLMYAARAGNFQMSQFILKRCDSAFHKAKDFNQETIITLAAVNGHTEYIRLMMPSIWLSNDVVRAAAQNDRHELQLLLDGGHDPNVTELNGLSALIICSMMNNRECFDLLLQYKVSFNIWDDTGRTAIHYAAACCNYYCMERLIEKGAVASWTNRQRENLLLIVAKGGFVDCTRIAISAILRERAMLATSTIVCDDEPSAIDTFKTSYHSHSEGEIICSLEAFDHKSRTALMHASERGYLEIVRMLLDCGATVNSSSLRVGKNALIYASASGQRKVVEELIVRGADVDFKDKTGCSSLLHAAKNGHTSCVVRLLQAGASITLTDNMRHNALTKALDNGHTVCADVLINAMTFEQLDTSKDSKGCNALIYAAKNGDINSFIHLLKAGLHLRSNDYFGNTPLMFSASFCQLDFVRFLVEHVHVSVNECNYAGLNALGMVVYYNLPSIIVQYLIDAGSNLHACEKNKGGHPLLFASQNGNESHFRILLSAGANIGQRDTKGESALSYAARKGATSIVSLALHAERAQGLMIPDRIHKRSLIYAVDCCHVEIVQLFLRMKVFDWSWYPCCMANLRGEMRVLLKSLVVLGISPDTFLYEEREFSPLKFALDKGDIATVKYLITNLYFSLSDYHLILKDPSICQKVEKVSDPSAPLIAKDLCSTPLPLVTLSFLTISSAIGSHCGLSDRREAVATLPIPDLFKRKLSFQEPAAKLCNDDWIKIDLNQRVLGYGCRWQSLFLKCTQREQPYATELYQCNSRTCVCHNDGLRIHAVAGGTVTDSDSDNNQKEELCNAIRCITRRLEHIG